MTRAVKVSVLGSIILLVFFLLTDPRELPSVLLVAPFVLLFAVMAPITTIVLGWYGPTRPKRLRLGLTFSASVVLLLLFQSLGQLTFRDALGIFALFGIAYFYLLRFALQPIK